MLVRKRKLPSSPSARPPTLSWHLRLKEMSICFTYRNSRDEASFEYLIGIFLGWSLQWLSSYGYLEWEVSCYLLFLWSWDDLSLFDYHIPRLKFKARHDLVSDSISTRHTLATYIIAKDGKNEKFMGAAPPESSQGSKRTPPNFFLRAAGRAKRFFAPHKEYLTKHAAPKASSSILSFAIMFVKDVQSYLS